MGTAGLLMGYCSGTVRVIVRLMGAGGVLLGY